MKDTKLNIRIKRRAFLSTLGASAAIAATLPANTILSETSAYADDIGPQGGKARAETAESLRVSVAEKDGDKFPIPNHPDNRDEALYPTRFASYSKCLLHNARTGEVDPAAYTAFLNAVHTGAFSDFEALVTNGHFGTSDPSKQRRLVNPVSGYAFDVEGVDSHQFKLPPAPAFASAQQAGEAVELYWMALLRDINFADYATSANVAAACADITKLSDFRGPKEARVVTPQTLFRDSYPGCTVGPYISQFLLQPCAFGAMRVDTRIAEVFATDFMTTFSSWLDVQNGVDTLPTPITGNLRYCLNARDLTHYVNIDQLFEAYFVAC